MSSPPLDPLGSSQGLHWVSDNVQACYDRAAGFMGWGVKRVEDLAGPYLKPIQDGYKNNLRKVHGSVFLLGGVYACFYPWSMFNVAVVAVPCVYFGSRCLGKDTETSLNQFRSSYVMDASNHSAPIFSLFPETLLAKAAEESPKEQRELTPREQREVTRLFSAVMKLSLDIMIEAGQRARRNDKRVLKKIMGDSLGEADAANKVDSQSKSARLKKELVNEYFKDYVTSWILCPEGFSDIAERFRFTEFDSDKYKALTEKIFAHAKSNSVDFLIGNPRELVLLVYEFLRVWKPISIEDAEEELSKRLAMTNISVVERHESQASKVSGGNTSHDCDFSAMKFERDRLHSGDRHVRQRCVDRTSPSY